MLHYVYFDGTSYFVADADFVCDEYTKVICKFSCLVKAWDYADRKNENR